MILPRYFSYRLIIVLSLLLLLGLYLVGTRSVLAQEGSSSAKPKSIKDLVYPIKDLGSCTDFNSCNTFCSDPVNYTMCAEYAKKNGFYKQDIVQAPPTAFWDEAKKALGCDSQESCTTFCATEGNFEKCDGFAKDKSLQGGYVGKPDDPELVKKAKAILGCDSATSCSSFCSTPANADKCKSFANSVGLVAGDVKQGPGGCSSETTCQSFCSDPNNFSKCQSFAPPNQPFKGPGGCDSTGSCRSQCETNPDSCRSYAPGSNGAYVPVACPAGQFFGPGGACTPNGKTKDATDCSQQGKFWSGDSCQDKAPQGIHQEVGSAFFQARPDMGGCKTPGECYDYCKANAGKCQGFNTDNTRPSDTYLPSLYYTPGSEVKQTPIKEMGNCASPGQCYDFCKENPGKCQGFDAKSPRPLDNYVPGTYYTPPRDFAYVTPPLTNFYVTPVYYTPPTGSTYTTPTYYTPGSYYTPTYYTPPSGSNYTTPTYYTPGSTYTNSVQTASTNYVTPTYNTPSYYTPPIGSNYTTPSYYTPIAYTSPQYYTPPSGSNYTTPSYYTPAAYNTPSYYTPPPYNTPVYYTPPAGSTYTSPSYYSPSTGSYTTPTYYTPPAGSNYTTPSYYSPSYYTPQNYTTPQYYTPPAGSTYTSPSYYSPSSYPSPAYYSPTGGSYQYPTPSGSYTSPSYYTPPSGSTYTSPTYTTPSYYTPPSGSTYTTPVYNTPPAYVTPTSYNTPSYGTPDSSYPTPSYPTPSYSYPTPSYGTPDSYSYPTPSYATPPLGAATTISPWKRLWYFFTK